MSTLPNSRLSGRVAIVTGGGSGIGKASARRLAADGASVAVVDIVGDLAHSVAAEITASGGTALAVVADVGEPDAVAAMVRTTTAAFGRLDILHNNAALLDPVHMVDDMAIGDLDVDHFDRTIRVNLRGYVLGCRYALPPMVAGGGGTIVNTSSQAAELGDLRMSEYGMAKAGINSLTRYVATQYGKAGIRANAVAPGIILTEGLLSSPQADEEMRAFFGRHTLTPWLGTPEDVANLVSFLASDEARYITGQVIGIDGGFSAHQPTYGELMQAVPPITPSTPEQHV